MYPLFALAEVLYAVLHEPFQGDLRLLIGQLVWTTEILSGGHEVNELSFILP